MVLNRPVNFSFFAVSYPKIVIDFGNKIGLECFVKIFNGVIILAFSAISNTAMIIGTQKIGLEFYCFGKVCDGTVIIALILAIIAFALISTAPIEIGFGRILVQFYRFVVVCNGKLIIAFLDVINTAIGIGFRIIRFFSIALVKALIAWS